MKVKKENLGYEMSKLGFQVNRECHSVVEEKTDKEVYDLAASSFEIDPAEVEMLVGEELTVGGEEAVTEEGHKHFDINVKATPGISNMPNLVWESSNPEIAIVTAEGVLRAIKVGEVIITATNADNVSMSAEMNVAVVNRHVEKHNLVLSMDGEGTGSVTGAGEYEEGETINITAVADSGSKFVKWSDDNEESEREIVMGSEDMELIATFDLLDTEKEEEKEPEEEPKEPIEEGEVD